MTARLLFRSFTLTLLLAVSAVFSGCEKPKLRSEGVEDARQSSSTLPAPGNSSSPAEPPPGSDIPAQRESPHDLPAPLPLPARDPEARAREYIQLQKRLDAQMVGIRSLESDFARHSAVLTELRNQLQLTRSRQAGAGTGGIRIERIRGESTLIDRRGEARELEMKIKAEEPFVAQLTTALAGARRHYEDLQKTAEALLSE